MRRVILTAWVIWLCDFITKSWAVKSLSSSPKNVIGSFLQIVLVRNSGAAFSVATGATIFLSALSVAVCIAVIYFAPRITSSAWLLVGGLLLGGVTGNLTDRIFRSPGYFAGHVIDWIKVAHWPVFNLADSAICVAAAIAFTLSMRNIAPITPLK